jgi:glycosyltransferase involved in cell wall biosynthesis
MHVLGHADEGSGRYGITGVERVVETLLAGLGDTIVQTVVYPPGGRLRDTYRTLAAAMLERAPAGRYDRSYSAALASFAREHATQVVLSHGLRYDFHAALVARHARVSHWVSRAVALADDSYPQPARSIYALVDRWTLARADGIVAVSEASKRRMVATQGLRAERITVIPNGVRVPQVSADERAAARHELGVGDTLVVGGVGQLIPRKAFEVLVDAVAQLPEPRPPLVILGDGPERQRLETRARDAGVRLVLPGFREDPYRFIAGFDISVLPSKAEGMPLVVLESMALGVACIASAVAGTPEIIEDGRTGLLVPAGDAEALTGALRRLLEDVPYRQAIAAAGAARAAREFSLEAMLSRFRTTLHAAARRER